MSYVPHPRTLTGSRWLGLLLPGPVSSLPFACGRSSSRVPSAVIILPVSEAIALHLSKRHSNVSVVGPEGADQ